MISNVTLEISLKPFYELTDSGIRSVCEKLYFQWLPLIREMEIISIMFWTADGSEILEYRGNLSDTFEWAKYIGVANPEVYGNIADLPTEQLSIHHAPRLYRDNPPEYTYGDLKHVLTILREVFASHGRTIRLGATFDPGPEFAKSPFKYKNHQEICLADTLGQDSELKSFVCCYATLKADPTPYAGFPDGIEEGTTFGKFLGRQTKHFCEDLGFDYIWLSNGFGFGLETWGVTGAVFDGEKFDNTSCQDVKDKIFRFWTDFRKELPDMPVENRGTNLSTGMDLASDVVPLREIYAEVPGIAPPPNSPWAALNGDFGMELAGWMSHIAELPKGSGYPFRFYTHDPWFINSPWLDRYGRNPHDIYMPMTITRLDKYGKTMGPDHIEFLTVDDSLGRMPDQVPDEVIPHVKVAMKNAPDAAGPVIWLYPFNEYHDMTFSGESLEEVFFGDWFMRSAINAGFQMNTVVSTGNFKAALDSGSCSNNVITAPTAVSNSPETLELLIDFIANGGKALLYGPVSNDKLKGLLGLETVADSVSGDLEAFIEGKTVKIKHNPSYSGGEIDTVSATDVTGLEIIGSVQEKTIVLIREYGSGQVAWVRGTNSFTIGIGGRYPEMLDPKEWFHPETLMRTLLGKLGYVCNFDKYSIDQQDPVVVTGYNQNALFMSTYVPDLNTAQWFRFPEGAPVFLQTETMIKDGKSLYHLPKASQLECRVFVDMPDGPVKCREFCPTTPEVTRRIEISGLKNATVRFRPVPGQEKSTQILANPGGAPFLKGDFPKQTLENGFAGQVVTVRNITGTLLISW